MENIKVISADIDGTLLSKVDVTRPSASTANTILDLRKHGFKFGLASGRPYEDVEHFAKNWNMEQFDFLICWNGCELWDKNTNKKYEYNWLTVDEIKEIIEFMKDSGSVINMYQPGRLLTSEETEKAFLSSLKTGREMILVNGPEDYYRHPNGGIMFRSNPETVRKYEALLPEFTKGKNYVGFKTQPDLLEFSSAQANKGYALSKYCELNGYTLDECASFGDTTNDNEMLKVSHGVCLLNGSDDTKACAEYITDKTIEDDGFTDFIYKHLL